MELRNLYANRKRIRKPKTRNIVFKKYREHKKLTKA